MFAAAQALSGARARVEHAWSKLKARFRCLQTCVPFKDVRDATVAIHAFAYLHNFLTTRNDMEPDEFNEVRAAQLMAAAAAPQEAPAVGGVPTGEARREQLSGWALANNGRGGQVLRVPVAEALPGADSDDD